MRRSLVFALLFAFLAGACEAPARAPARTSEKSHAARQRTPPGEWADAPNESSRVGAPVEWAFQREQRDVWVVGIGSVERVLRDDSKRPRHQRFVLRIAPDQTVLVAHNIDLAPRVPLGIGDSVTFRGEYVWNPQGGIIHQTHRDLRIRSAGGWVAWNGRYYR